MTPIRWPRRRSYINPTSAATRAAQHADPPSPELTASSNTPQAPGGHGRPAQRRRCWPHAGFSVNTANFFTTEDEIGYGEEISTLTNGSHHVIDTSRNETPR